MLVSIIRCFSYNLIMKEILGNVIYGQSGGPTSIINTSAYYLFKECFNKLENKIKIYAMKYGIEGLLEENIIEVKDNDNLNKLLVTPGAYFGSNRYKLKDDNLNVFDKILETFKKYNIRYFFYNGGNDSMDTINKISTYFKKVNYECYCIGINKTIDNDLLHTDFSLGYASASKFIINTILEIYADDKSYKVGRVNIIETMGRNAGWLAASSKLCSLKGDIVDFILIPEKYVDLEDFLIKISEVYKRKKHCIICVSEGIKNLKGEFIFENDLMLDKFGHNQLGGVSIKLCELIKNRFNIKTRYYELSLLQRANSMYLSKIEEQVAKDLSIYALNAALNKENNKMVVINRLPNTNRNNYKYDFSLVPIKEVSNKERYLDDKFILKNKYDIDESFIDYLLPLVDGEGGLLDILK